MSYLDQHPPRRSQSKARPRQPSGTVVVHTAESMLDVIGVDTGAEGVANYISTRTTPGSYHDLCDSDSIINVVDYSLQAWGDGTGSNPHAYHVSGACRTTDWTRMSADRRAAFVENMAIASSRYAKWLKARTGTVIPARRITREQSSAGLPGFIGHGERDPGRRSDPGAAFPWALFLKRFAYHCGQKQAQNNDTEKEQEMALKDESYTNPVSGKPEPASVTLAYMEQRIVDRLEPVLAKLAGQVAALGATVKASAAGKAVDQAAIERAAREGAADAINARITDASVELTVQP